MTAHSRSSLALHGGAKVIAQPLRRYNPIGTEERDAAVRVINSGVLSQFIGVWGPDFFGGPEVQAFERECEAYFGVRHAITVNSWTSGLVAAVGALGLEPGDEVIVSPWTMSATATAVLHWNALPVFADIEPETFCLDPRSVEANITPHTRAIVSVDIFGHPANTEAINALARKHGLKVISDTAQAPGARRYGRYAGTLTDIGGYSLNYHKHIHTGEGGILVTDDEELATRLRLIRNHAEVVVGAMGRTDLNNMVGHNFRLGEIESAMGREQLKKLEVKVASRQHAAARLAAGLSGLDGLRLPVTAPDATHVYYVFPMVLDIDAVGVPKARIVEALRAEGVEGIASAYQNIHLLPMYQQKQAYGTQGFPWTAPFCRRDIDYRKGICPVAETLQDSTYIGFSACMHQLDDADVDLIIEAFRKVWAQREVLR